VQSPLFIGLLHDAGHLISTEKGGFVMSAIEIQAQVKSKLEERARGVGAANRRAGKMSA